MSYFVLSSGEDGIYIQEYKDNEKDKLLNYIAEESGDDYQEELEILDKVPESDRGCWVNVSDRNMLIIKGKIVVPKPKNVVKKYEMD